MRFFPETVIDSDWKKWKGYPVDWKNPRDINEKIQWLMCRSDTSLWTVCADKYRVREYVASKGLEDILVPLLGVWKRAEDVEVRVDFYDVEGKLYFGELIFSSLSGRMTYFTQSFLEELGAQCILPNAK